MQLAKCWTVLLLALTCSVPGTPWPLPSAAHAQAVQTDYRRAADYAAAHGGVGLLVIRGERTVYEQFAPGRSAETPHLLASGTKSFTGVMAAAAVQDGLLTFEERVAETITEWKADPLKSQITVRHLLSLTSGLAKAGRGGKPVSFAQAVQVAAVSPPGRDFDYNPVNFQLFGELMRRKLAPHSEAPIAYLQRRILSPIGMRIARWRTTADGDPDLPGGAIASARDWARFGLLIKNGGTWQGRQIVSKDVLAQCFVRSAANPAYGLTFWLNAPSRSARPERNNPLGGAGPADLFMAAGAGGQRLYIIPSMDLLVVRQGDLRSARGAGGGRFRDDEFIRALL
ncbi:MAG: beta-lactamase family protein [Aphanocapsa lilacina HA4352-LM1]|jgi:CubicO group peptidase (beta-lactamase class C family)|nr:beta-lactamase family protein [Aphanocapsa lilacina HA4352-LM1]